MFEPSFNKDHFNYQVNEIERLKFRIERLLIMPKHEQWLRREAFLRAAYSSTMIENATIQEQEMEEAIRPTPSVGSTKERLDVANNINALEFVDFLSTSEEKVSETTIRHIHWLVMKGINDTRLTPGQYRTEPNWIEDQGIKVYEPVSHLDVPMLMREFSIWLQEDTDTNPILSAGIAHAHLIAIHPFVDGNGRTARLLATLLLQKNGYGFRNLLSLDAFYQRNRDAYLDSLNKSLGQRFSYEYDFSHWLHFFLKSVIAQASKLEAKLTDWRMMVDRVHKILAPTGLSDRQIDGLIYAIQIGTLTRKDYIAITGLSPLTATRDLAKMVEMRILKPSGYGRNREYICKVTLKEDEETQEKLL